jgi:hypothetical protein
MVSTLSQRRVYDEPVSLSYNSNNSAARVSVVKSRPVAFDNSEANLRMDTARVVKGAPQHIEIGKPYLVPVDAPKTKGRRIPVLVRINRALQASLIALCGVAIFCYGMNVNQSDSTGRLQEQVRRLSEQNSELAQKLLKMISYQDIAKSSHGTGLKPPDVVKTVSEVPAPKVNTFKPAGHHLPLLTSY